MNFKLDNVYKLIKSQFSSGNMQVGQITASDIELFPTRPSKYRVGDSFQQSLVTNNNYDGIPPERRKELENWKLDWELYVDADNIEKEDEMCDYHFEHKKEILDIYNGWYQEYLTKHNGEEMNFLTAIQYLKDNPNEDESIKEFIKKSFGICDGEVSGNQQMGKGSCHLLSCRKELGDSDDPELQEIARNIVKQNEDGTVTVTFEGIRDEQGKPLKFTVKNEDIKKSYTEFDATNNLLGGSTDPDDAALELGYQKLKEFLIKNYPMDYETKFNEVKDNIEKCEEEITALWNENDKILDTVYENGYNKIFEQLKTSDKPEDKQLLDFIINNADGNENDKFYVQSLIKSKTAKDTQMTYNYFDEYLQATCQRTCNMKHLMEDKIIELLKKDGDFEELNNQYQNNKERERYLYDDKGKLNKIGNKLSTLKALYDETELGSRADLTFKLLTGKGKYIRELKFDEMRQYLNNNKDNLKKIPIEVSGHFYRHAFMFDKPIVDKEDDKIKEVVLSNPHNTGEKEDNYDFTTSGNFENVFNMNYFDFLNSYSITVIDKEPDESKENYFQLPFNYETY